MTLFTSKVHPESTTVRLKDSTRLGLANGLFSLLAPYKSQFLEGGLHDEE